MKNKATTLLVGPLLLAVALSGCSTSDGSNSDKNNSSADATYSCSTSAESNKNTKNDSNSSFKVAADKETTALQLLADKTKGNCTISNSSNSPFVTGIKGVAADGKTDFWALYINGKMSDKGAAEAKLNKGDEMTWKIEMIK